MSKVFTTLGVALVAVMAGIWLGGGVAHAQNQMCIVFDIGGRGDLSFNDMAALGGDLAVQEIGMFQRLVEVQSNTQADYLPNLRTLSRRRSCGLIVGVGFLLTDAMITVADEFPNQKFAIIDGFVPDKPNVLSVLYKENEGSALVGVLAALIAAEYDADSVGVVLGIEIPILWKFEVGYKWGVAWAETWFKHRFNRDLDVNVQWVYTGSFSDPALGLSAAEVQLRQGAIVLYNVAGQVGLGMFEAVAAEGRAQGRTMGPPFAIGVDADQDYIEPGFIVASMMKRVDMGVLTAARLVASGEFEGGILELGLNEGGIAVSKVEDIETFLRLGVQAGTVEAEDSAQIIETVLQMRLALPPFIFDAVAELEDFIRSGLIEVPLVVTPDEIERYRNIFG